MNYLQGKRSDLSQTCINNLKSNNVDNSFSNIYNTIKLLRVTYSLSSFTPPPVYLYFLTKSYRVRVHLSPSDLSFVVYVNLFVWGIQYTSPSLHLRHHVIYIYNYPIPWVNSLSTKRPYLTLPSLNEARKTQARELTFFANTIQRSRFNSHTLLFSNYHISVSKVNLIK